VQDENQDNNVVRETNEGKEYPKNLYGFMLSYIGRMSQMAESYPKLKDKIFNRFAEFETECMQEIVKNLPKSRQVKDNGEFASLPPIDRCGKKARKKPLGSPSRQWKRFKK